MTSKQQQDLAADCAQVRDLHRQALNWISDPENAELVGAEAKSLSHTMRKGARRARRLAKSAMTPMSVSVFGPSQAGKSFLVSVLARPQGGRLVGDFKGGALDYIREVNPEGEGESTGLVTRFTMRKGHTPEGYPIKLTLLSEADIVRTIINSFYNDGDESEVPPEPSDLTAHLNEYRAKMGSAQPGLDADDFEEIGEYVKTVFWKSPYAGALKGFWEDAAEVAPNLSIADRAGFFSILWGGHEALGALYQQLAEALASLDHAEEVYAEIAALVPREQSIIDVKTLKGLRGADVGPPLRVQTDNGRDVSIARAEICALAAELVFPMQDQPSDLFGRTDLLDFPGARNRFEEPLDKKLANLDDNLHELLLRGKVAYLFDRYVENQEITSMLLCIPGSNMDTLDLPGLVDNWIALTHGNRPDLRAQTDNALFFVLTKFDMQLGDSAADGGAVTRFQRRMEASLLERFGRSQDGWVAEWTPGKPFDNCYWLRNPNYFVEGLIDYDDNKREVQLRPDKQGRISELKNGCLEAEHVQRHFAEPERAWDAALTLNDGGVTYLTEQLSLVCKPDAKLRQIKVQLNQVADTLMQAMGPFYVSDDVEQRIEEKKQAAYKIIDDLEQALARHRFGAVLASLMVDQDEIEGRIARVPSTIRITSAVSSAAAQAAEPVSTAAPAPRGPQRPGAPARPRPGPAATPAPEAPAPNGAANGHPADDIRTMTLEQFQAESALEAWIERLKSFRDDAEGRRAFGMGDTSSADLVAELIHAARRTGLARTTAAGLEAINFGLSVEKQAQPAAILGAESINGFVSTLGMEEIPEAERPQVQAADGSMRPIFVSRPGAVSVDDLPAQPRNTSEEMWSDWVYGLEAVFVANAKDGAGGEINIEQNMALGGILNALQERAAT